LVEEFEQNGVTILDEIETYDYGKLLHILDGKGNKIELWEPVGEGFEKTAERTTL
ncbi:MAG: putative enzyme related to lactoylglutathione lyase, partial [Flavobacteriales bacterium]